MATHNAQARWNGVLSDGHGTVEVAGKELGYSFRSRFEGEGDGTSPEALIGAAHSGCLAMALSHELAQAGHTVHHVDVKAAVRVTKQDDGFLIDRIQLTVRAKVDGVDDAGFQEIAKGAKENCPLSKALASVPTIEMDAALVD